ncbi:MAG: glycogen debranching protein [Actinomycetota bacterium]
MTIAGQLRASAFIAVALLLVSPPLSATRASAVPTADPERSTRADLADKRWVAAGDRAYVIGAEDGTFPPMGWHIRGEMGGVWAHPIKLLDGYWFAVNGRYPTARNYTTGVGYARLDFPARTGIRMTQTAFSPDGSPVVLVGVELRNTGRQAKAFSLRMDARSDILSAYPWSWTEPSAGEFNRKDEGRYERSTGTLEFEEPGKPWHALVRTSQRPKSGRAGDDIWGPVPRSERAGYSEEGNGTGGRMQWNLRLDGRQQETLWLAVAGSHTSKGEAEAALDTALAAPEALLDEKIRHRQELLGRTKVDLPDEGLEAAFDWGKLNMQELRRTVTDVHIRDVDEGRAYPAPVGTVPELTGIGAGYPDYPWYFGTDGAYTAHPLVVSGQWDTAAEHLRSIKVVSRMLNGDTGKVVHEVVTDGSVYWGNNEHAGNTNETSQFATAVHLVWRWTGDDGFRDEMYDFVVDGLRYVMSRDCVVTCDKDQDNWPEGNGMVERTGMGSEKLDVTAYQWQALRALQDMALSKGDAGTAEWAGSEADAMESGFEDAWWMDDENLYADSRCNSGDEGEEGSNVCTAPDQKLQQYHWINATPMEVVLDQVGLDPTTGDLELATREHAHTALDRLESDTFTGDCGLFHTGVGGGPVGAGELRCWTLPSSVMAVAEANYGRVADDQAPFYMHTISDQLDLEMPGALPEIAPSPEYDPFVDFRERAMFMQAWSSYGVQWPVIHHFLGIRPDVPDGHLYVVPQVPDSWPGLSVTDLAVGSASVAASAAREDHQYVTEVEATGEPWSLTIGHTIPEDATIESVTLDGAPVVYEEVVTSRGREVHVDTTTSANHRLVVTTE